MIIHDRGVSTVQHLGRVDETVITINGRLIFVRIKSLHVTCHRSLTHMRNRILPGTAVGDLEVRGALIFSIIDS